LSDPRERDHMNMEVSGVRLVLLLLIVHMVRTASLSAESSDSVREGGREREEVSTQFDGDMAY